MQKHQGNRTQQKQETNKDKEGQCKCEYKQRKYDENTTPKQRQRKCTGMQRRSNDNGSARGCNVNATTTVVQRGCNVKATTTEVHVDAT
jgi:hypothetical protein